MEDGIVGAEDPNAVSIASLSRTCSWATCEASHGVACLVACGLAFSPGPVHVSTCENWRCGVSALSVQEVVVSNLGGFDFILPS